MGYRRIEDGSEAKAKGGVLTPKMSRFVEEYLISSNASEAVLLAGYKTRNPNRMGSELLRHPLVKEAIDKAKDERRERVILSQDFVINKLIDIVQKTEDGNPTAALRGLELLGKHLGLYKERQEISGPDGEAIQMEQKVQENVQDFTRKLARLAASGGAGTVVKLSDRSGESDS